MIRVEHLTKRYGETLAVHDLSFDVEEGEILGFLGPNGAGKTTTMRMLTGFLAPTRGSIAVAGHDIQSDSLDARRAIGYLPENVPLYEDMRVREYLLFRARLKEVPRSAIPMRIGEAMDRVGIEDRARDLIGHLSRGYRQRVGIAACLIHRPRVLILDEPTVGLDPGQIRSIRNVIRELGGDHTILLSTHILPEVEAVCEKVIILAEGRRLALDTPANLIRQLEEGGVILAEVRGKADRLRAAIEKVSGTGEVEIRERDGLLHLEVGTAGQDLREEVSRAIVAGGGIIREFRIRRMTLEDVFLEITTQEESEA